MQAQAIQRSLPGGELTVFNAGERFYMARKQLEHTGHHLEELTSKQDPGVLDLCVQFSMLRTISNKVAMRFERYGEDGARNLKERDLKLLNNLEILIHEFQSTLRDARAELLVA